MVILLGLIFLLDRSTQDQTRKIGFIFFRALFHLICIYKVQVNFWNFLNRLEKVLTSRDTCRTPRAPGRGGLGVGFRDMWRTRTSSGLTKPRKYGKSSRLGSRDAWHSRTASEGLSRLRHSGHVALLAR